MLLRILKVVIAIFVLVIATLGVYLYQHRYELDDCEPPYFQYEASVGGKDNKKYISVGLMSSSSSSEISDAIIDIEFPPNIRAVKTDKLQHLSQHENVYRWNVNRIDKGGQKSKIIPIIVDEVADNPIAITYAFKLSTAQNCPGDKGGVYTNTVYIHNVTKSDTPVKVNHGNWQLSK